MSTDRTAAEREVTKGGVDREWLDFLEQRAHELSIVNDDRRRYHRTPAQIHLDPEEVAQLVAWARKGLAT